MKLTVENLTKLIKEEIDNFVAESSFASQKAKEFGLIHRGFGTYSKDPDGPVIYRTGPDGKLIKVKNVGKWQKYRSEKEKTKSQDKETPEFNIDPVISKHNHVTNVRYVGNRQYKFLYGDSKKTITFSEQEFNILSNNQLNIIQIITDKLKEIEKKKKRGVKASNLGIYNDFD